ncbi:MBL fold metallo-hydrolase [Streptomyces sp. NPDC048751]|uniref:MBL fold metallo-hydrolase n=1 Tax=Streptomyces sp. NPDC048751 TaxID=3365591 RepID=UPI0037217D18
MLVVGVPRAVVLTHAHLDHVGLAERLRQEAGATVWVHARDEPALASPSGRRPTPSLRRAWAVVCSATPPRCECPCIWPGRGRSARRPSPRPVRSMTA